VNIFRNGGHHHGDVLHMNLSLICYISGAFARILSLGSILVCSLMLSYSAYAGGAGIANPGNPPQTGKRFGIIWRISGDVIVEPDGSGNARPLQEGSPVYVGEHLRSADNGEAVIKTDDAGMVAVRPRTQFIPERFAADGKKTDNMTLRLVKGSLRVITGWIGRVNRAEDHIMTPGAIIGIRGTDHEPYVLPADLAELTKYSEGTYDKVNRGKTTLGEGDQLLEINSGRVGFFPAPTIQAKGLMTILMPVLLDKVPNFYVPGKFDVELDKYSRTADADSAKQLKQKRNTAVTKEECEPTKIANDWLNRFDGAVAKHNATAVLELFSPEVAIRATVRNTNGEMTTVSVSRDEMAKSTIAAIQRLEHYRQRRLTLEAEQAASDTDASCDRISLRSSVIEQGEQSGKPYRFESTEDYLLELHEGKWLAIKAETTQR
jgi:hypothetical protein